MTQESGQYHRFKEPPWGTRCSSHVVSTPALGSYTRKTKPLSLVWKPAGLSEELFKKQRLSSERALTFLPVPAQRQQPENGLVFWSACSGGPRVHTGLLLQVLPLRRYSPVRQRLTLPTVSSTHTWRERSWLEPWPRYDQGRSSRCWCTWPCLSTHLSIAEPAQQCSSNPLLSTQPLTKGMHTGEKAETAQQ